MFHRGFSGKNNVYLNIYIYVCVYLKITYSIYYYGKIFGHALNMEGFNELIIYILTSDDDPRAFPQHTVSFNTMENIPFHPTTHVGWKTVRGPKTQNEA